MNKILKILSVGTQTPTPAEQTLQGMVLSLLVAILLAGVMMGCYRLCHDSLTYNRKFNLTLMMLTLSSTVLLTLIRSHPMFSLGAIGALSICRVRTNTRDPRDLGFVFLSLMIGISCAMDSFAVGLVGTLTICAVALIFTKLEHRQKTVTIIVRGQKPQIARVQTLFHGLKGSTIQAENIFRDSFELVCSVDIPKEEEEQLLIKLNQMDGIDGVNVLAPETEVA